MKNKTYKQKMGELQQQAVRIIVNGLNNPDVGLQFVLACQFLSTRSASDLGEEYVEDDSDLDAEILTTKEL